MPLEPPFGLSSPILGVLAGGWPQSDENGLQTLGDEWDDAASTAYALSKRLSGTISAGLATAAPSPDGLLTMRLRGAIVQQAADLDSLARHCESMATQCREGAKAAEFAKLLVTGTLYMLAIQLAVDAAMVGWGTLKAMADRAYAAGVIRCTIWKLIARVAQSGASAATRRAALPPLARSLVMAGGMGAAFGGGLNYWAQNQMVTGGKSPGYDIAPIAESAIAGVAGGMAGLGVGRLFARGYPAVAGDPIGRIGRYYVRTASGLMLGAASGAAGNAAALVPIAAIDYVRTGRLPTMDTLTNALVQGIGGGIVGAGAGVMLAGRAHRAPSHGADGFDAGAPPHGAVPPAVASVDVALPDPSTAKGPFVMAENPGSSGDGYYIAPTDRGRVKPTVWGKYGAAGLLIRHVDAAGTERFLLLKAAPGYSQGNWHFPGGALRSNETPAQGATRETHEESGADPAYLAKLIANGSHVANGPEGWTYSTFTADARERFEPVLDGVEVEAARWATRSELRAMADGGELHSAIAANLDSVLGTFREPHLSRALLEFPGVYDKLIAKYDNPSYQVLELKILERVASNPELQGIPTQGLVAVRAYTGDGGYYGPLNAAWRSRSLVEMASYRVPGDAVRAGLAMLPPSYTHTGKVNRGLEIPKSAIPGFLARYQPGEVILEKAPVSATVGKREGYPLRFEIESRTGKRIDALSERPYENEVLFGPDAPFKSLAQWQDEDGSWVIALAEVPDSAVTAAPALARALREAEIERARSMADGNAEAAAAATARIVQLQDHIAPGLPHPDHVRPAPRDGNSALRTLRDARDLGFDVSVPEVIIDENGVPPVAVSYLVGAHRVRFDGGHSQLAAALEPGQAMVVSDRTAGAGDSSQERTYLVIHDGQRVWRIDRESDPAVSAFDPGNPPYDIATTHGWLLTRPQPLPE